MRRWNDKIDPATIPDEVVASEHGKRNARQRKSYTGGRVWGKHNPDFPSCRCQECIDKRGGHKRSNRPQEVTA